MLMSGEGQWCACQQGKFDWTREHVTSSERGGAIGTHFVDMFEAMGCG